MQGINHSRYFYVELGNKSRAIMLTNCRWDHIWICRAILPNYMQYPSRDLQNEYVPWVFRSCFGLSTCRSYAQAWPCKQIAARWRMNVLRRTLTIFRMKPIGNIKASTTKLHMTRTLTTNATMVVDTCIQCQRLARAVIVISSQWTQRKKSWSTTWVLVMAFALAHQQAYNSGGGTEYASSGQSSGNNPKDGPLDTPERQHATTAKMTTSSPEPPRPKALRTSKPADEITLYKKVMPPPMKYRESVLLLHYDKNCRYLRKGELSEHKFTMRTVQSNWLCTVCMKGSPLENWCWSVWAFKARARATADKCHSILL